MIIDINNRQTGKTTRLFEEATRLLTEGRTEKVYFISPNHSMATTNKRRFKDNANCLQQYFIDRNKIDFTSARSFECYHRGKTLDYICMWDDCEQYPDKVKWRTQDYYTASEELPSTYYTGHKIRVSLERELLK